ncbi:MAG TPA: FAD-dependent oxidoreductase [Polyangiales bacterium]|nr:FAD-dependent oxidoreductase [Polyangiales bacterium]
MQQPDAYLERRAQMFPKMDEQQLARVARVGKRRSVARGEVLIEAGSDIAPFFVVLSGAIEILRFGALGEERIALHSAGEFTGEMNMLSGRRNMFEARMQVAGEVLELDAEGLRRIVQTDSNLSELLMRAYILRRMALIQRNQGVLMLGSRHCAATLRVREFLTRNSQPYSYLDVDSDPDVQPLLDRFHVAPSDVPLLVCCGGEMLLRHPTNAQVAEALGLNRPLDQERIHDVVIVGAGPGGLAASVYAASEGLDVLVLETTAPGGQAGSSSKIENYLGFPTGISGQALAGRAYAQAQKFGAELLIAQGALRLDCDHTPYAIHLTDGRRVLARTIVVASGARYRKPPIDQLGRFEGMGVYYGATRMEAQLCGEDELIVVGGGNSAGQAAVFLAEHARHVHVLVRSSGLADTMSRYLIRRIEDSPKITLRPYTEIEALEGEEHLERVRWRNNKNGAVETRAIRHVFLMTGADPNTSWLEGCVALDDKGFVKTGIDLHEAELAQWPLARPPLMFETSIPRVFAVGDVRSGSVKRVASAVGEGSVSVQLIHRVLAEH